MAHFVLPIRNKGSSEFYYGWVAVVGPLIGGIIAGFFTIICEDIIKVNV